MKVLGEVADSVLLVSIVAYAWCAVLPFRVTGFKYIVLEKIGMALAGSLIYLQVLVLKIKILGLALGCLWTLAALLSYFGVVTWRMRQWPYFSKVAQVFMAAWDLAIAGALIVS